MVMSAPNSTLFEEVGQIGKELKVVRVDDLWIITIVFAFLMDLSTLNLGIGNA